MLIFKFFSILAKTFYFFVNVLKLGKGTTYISNYYIKYFEKNICFKDFVFSRGIIFVTGTNGKTTTSKVLSEILGVLGFKVLNNKTGGNILRSILGMFLLEYKFFEKNKYDFLVLEVDEASVEAISRYLKPNILILLNFSRDQLDRYFEIENISSNIVNTLNNHPETLIVFNVNDTYCLNIIEQVENDSFPFEKNLKLLKESNFSEEYMAENLDAVEKTLLLNRIKTETFIPFLKKIKKAYGRGEILEYKGIKFYLNLAKNPSSFDKNLIELYKAGPIKNVLILLNDDFSDGTDISWIYDIEPELLNRVLENKNLYFSGSRAYEMAQRVRYATNDFNLVLVERNIKECLNDIKNRKIEDVYVLCNYSAMLNLRKNLVGKKIL
jgi:lipid II isoglutaminyl synthase (glutamine-hydrolysing)